MECRRVPKLPEGDQWLYEAKLEGYRVIGLCDRGTTEIFSMSGMNFSARFPAIALALKQLRIESAVFDREVVALESDGRPNFQELQNYRTTKLPIVYYVFDLLHLDGNDLLGFPLTERRAKLEKLTRATDHLRDRFGFGKVQFGGSLRRDEAGHDRDDS